MPEEAAPPDALIEHLRSRSRQEAIYEHAIGVKPSWWNGQTELPGGPLRADDDGSQMISRATLFALADGAVTDKSGVEALTLLWAHTGVGNRHEAPQQ